MQTQTQTKMTAAEAKSFDSYSQANYMLLKAVLTCGCEPYNDVFTYRRWQAQGYQVRKGEKSKRITVYIQSEREVETDSGETKTETKRRPWTAHVFCRCQVDKKG